MSLPVSFYFLVYLVSHSMTSGCLAAKFRQHAALQHVQWPTGASALEVH